LGFSVTNMKPPLACLPANATPSRRGIVADDVDELEEALPRDVNELDWSDCSPPTIWPVSCCGKKPWA